MEFFIRSDRCRGYPFVVILSKKQQSGITFRIIVVDHIIPFFSRMEDKFFQILSGFFPWAPLMGKPGNIFRPYRKNIQYDVFLIKRKGSVSGIKYFEQSLGKRKDPNYLLSTFFGAITPPCLHIMSPACEAFFPGNGNDGMSGINC